MFVFYLDCMLIGNQLCLNGCFSIVGGILQDVGGGTHTDHGKVDLHPDVTPGKVPVTFSVSLLTLNSGVETREQNSPAPGPAGGKIFQTNLTIVRLVSNNRIFDIQGARFTVPAAWAHSRRPCLLTDSSKLALLAK